MKPKGTHIKIATGIPGEGAGPNSAMPPSATHCAVVGRGRLGTALAAALRAGGVAVQGPLGRDERPRAGGGAPLVVLLCVPDAAIASAAAALRPASGVLVGHCSGATTLAPLDGHEALSLHPLMTVPPGAAAGALRGAAAAVAGSTARALEAARGLACAAGMRPIEIADADRVAYHTAASIASNFVVTLQDAAERLAATAGMDRDALAPLVRRAVDNWAQGGADHALTGPIARGDEETVALQRAAVQERTPDLVGLFDALADRTRSLARGRDETVAA